MTEDTPMTALSSNSSTKIKFYGKMNETDCLQVLTKNNNKNFIHTR